LTETVNCDLRSSLLTLGIADASIAGLRREWGLTPLCEAAATFSGYSEGLSRLSLNRSLQLSTMKCLTYPPSLCHSLYKGPLVIYHLPFYVR